MATTLYGWGAAFGAPSPSMYVIKADIQLQMLGVAFDRAIADLESVDKHKAPYVRDDDVLVQDSTFIRWHFEQKLGLDLDAGLSAEQRGAAWALGTALEGRLSTIAVNERWMIDANFDRGPRLFFAAVPDDMRDAIIAQVRDDHAKSMQGNGIGRFTAAERVQLAAADVAAAADILGAKPYFFGDAPTAVDASAFGVLASCATRYFDSELPGIIESHANIVAYLERMQTRFFAEERWPAMR